MPIPPVLPRAVLVAATAFPNEIGAGRAANAIIRGLRTPGVPLQAEVLLLEDRQRPLDEQPAGGSGAAAWRSRLGDVRAVVLAAARLWDKRGTDELLARDPVFELATLARQRGIPAYGIFAEPPCAFDARILDLQVVLGGAMPRALTAAGRGLATLIYEGQS